MFRLPQGKEILCSCRGMLVFEDIRVGIRSLGLVQYSERRAVLFETTRMHTMVISGVG